MHRKVAAVRCEFPSLTIGDRCSRCGYELTRTYNRPPVRQCESPSLSQKVWNYTKAVTRWKLAGSPTRDQAEIDRILSICKACPYYVEDKRPHCNLCGCSCNAQAEGLQNKIAMATESCPLDPPKWTSDRRLTPRVTARGHGGTEVSAVAESSG